MANWWALIKERFSPQSYIPMILVFAGANGIYGTIMTHQNWSWSRFGLVFIVMASFFFRMRLFDEIKDYEVDLQINPTRPLARGILSIADVKRAIGLLLLVEILITASLGLGPLLVHSVAIGYSLLMYEEFFIGDLLRPHLTTYAISHTFVSTLLGFSCAVDMTGQDPFQLPRAAYYFFFMNWAFFNLFEFARKTFAPSEERENVPSYSKIFGCPGAVALSLLQGVIGVGIFFCQASNIWTPLALLLYVFFCLPYLIKTNEKNAKLFRTASGVYLLVHFILLIFVLGV